MTTGNSRRDDVLAPPRSSTPRPSDRSAHCTSLFQRPPDLSPLPTATIRAATAGVQPMQTGMVARSIATERTEPNSRSSSVASVSVLLSLCGSCLGWFRQAFSRLEQFDQRRGRFRSGGGSSLAGDSSPETRLNRSRASSYPPATVFLEPRWKTTGRRVPEPWPPPALPAPRPPASGFGHATATHRRVGAGRIFGPTATYPFAPVSTASGRSSAAPSFSFITAFADATARPSRVCSSG